MFMHVQFDRLAHKSVYAGNVGYMRLAREEYDTKDLQKQLEKLETLNRRAQRQPVGSTVKCPKCRQKIFNVPKAILSLNLQHGMNVVA